MKPGTLQIIIQVSNEGVQFQFDESFKKWTKKIRNILINNKYIFKKCVFKTN